MHPDRPIHLLSVPFNSAGRTDGVARAPAALRSAGLVDALRATGREVIDRGDVSLRPPSALRDAGSGVIGPEALAEMIAAVRAAVAEILEADAFPIVVGGDCPVLLGCLGAAGGASGIGLVFVDGHEDAWPPQQSTTGEAADMELGLALGLTTAGLPAALREMLPALDAADVVAIGPRDGGELAGAGVPSLRGRVTIIGPQEVGDGSAAADAALARLAHRDALWLHVDLDVLATASLAAVDYPLPGGLDWETLTRLTRRVLSRPATIGWDVTIYNPDLDPAGAGARRIVAYVGASLGG